VNEGYTIAILSDLVNLFLLNFVFFFILIQYISMKYWLMKTEPDTYSWEDLLQDKMSVWDGVRNYLARNNMRKMKEQDLVFIYHSVKQKTIVGIAKVTKEAYPDVTVKEGDWSVVEIVPVKEFVRPVVLAEVKQHPSLLQMALVTHMRLSVQPVTKKEWEICLKMGKTEL